MSNTIIHTLPTYYDIYNRAAPICNQTFSLMKNSSLIERHTKSWMVVGHMLKSFIIRSAQQEETFYRIWYTLKSE
ncbi:unnamed protein product [Spirodela intermedia]|uniref:Uncharacterized protein n=1 Tax=Spirodela intermedia TaxID=51605 RepID=A0A7I8L3Y6_SPIIN|nr:unnamed protein product [Spirodela intermedia]